MVHPANGILARMFNRTFYRFRFCVSKMSEQIGPPTVTRHFQNLTDVMDRGRIQSHVVRSLGGEGGGGGGRGGPVGRLSGAWGVGGRVGEREAG